MHPKIVFLLICILFYSNVMGENLRKADIVLTDIQCKEMAEGIKSVTPEHTHYAKGTVFKWVLLELDNSIPTNLRDEIIKQFSKYYTIYFNESEIPSKDVIRQGKDLIGYNDGFSFNVRIEQKGVNELEVFFSDFEGNLAAFSSSIKCLWNGSDWIQTGQGPMTIS